ncbi:MAG: hypothetical protein EHM67_03150, partial [Hyphomicrobiaceae bacterium]
MAMQTEAIGRAPRAAFLLEGFPLLPTLILIGIALVALLAELLAPHNPEIGSLAARFRPPAW